MYKKINVRIDIEYDGTEFHGWQLQKEGRTVQGEIEAILEELYGKRIAIVGSGRTDAGVHALNQIVNFKIPDKYDINTLKDIFNAKFPPDIILKNIQEVDKKFNARFSAKSRQYKYVFYTHKRAITRHYGWYVPFDVDFEKMKKASFNLKGCRDYRVFSKVDRKKENFDVEIKEIEWIEDPGMIIFRIKANRFLRNMVRNIVGTLIDIGRDKLTEEKMMELIEKKDRENFGFCAPAAGLFLEKVEY